MQSNTKKILAWILIPLAIIIILLLIANPILENQIDKKLQKSLGEEVNLNYNSLDVNIFNQSVKLDQVKWMKIKEEDSLHSGSIETLNFTGIGVIAFLFGEKNLNFNNILINNVEVNIYPQPKDTAKKSVKTHYEMIEKSMNELSIDEFSLNNLNLRVYNKEKKEESSIEGLNLDLKNFLLNQKTAEKHEGSFTIEEYNLHINNTAQIMEKGLHKMQTGKIQTSFADKTLSVDSIEIVPQYAKNELAGVYGYQTNWMDVVVGKIEITGFDFDLLMNKQNVKAAHAQISGLRYESFREKAYDYHPDRYTYLPQLSFKEIEIPISLDSVTIENAYFQYEEHVPPANQNGEVFFSDANVEIKNLSNRTKEAIEIHASAKLLDVSTLTVDISMPMDNESGLHYVKGNLVSMDMTALNQVFEPLAFFSIQTGTLNSLYFNFSADSTSSNGDVKFNYDNLKVKLIEKENLERTGALKEIASFLANTFVIEGDNDKNEAGKGTVSTEDIYYERNTKKSILNYWWKSLFSGMKSTAVNIEAAIPEED